MQKSDFKSVITLYVELFLIALLGALVIVSFFLRWCTVDGSSMEKTLSDGQRLIVSDLFYSPKRGDVIVFHQTGNSKNEPLVKRVIALPGDEIRFDGQKVYVNGEKINEEYAFFDPTRPGIKMSEDAVIIPEGYVFVMGDNRNNSLDSRSSDIGLVDTRRIIGRVLFRIAPMTFY